MLEGFAFLVTQIAVLLLAAVVLGFLAGRYLWPRWPRGQVGGPAELVTLQQRLASSEAEAEGLRAAVMTIADSKEAEMGRLESGAIEALDKLISTHQRTMADLEGRLQTAVSAAREHERELEAERRHALRLQAALVDRDERVAALLNGTADRQSTT